MVKQLQLLALHVWPHSAVAVKLSSNWTESANNHKTTLCPLILNVVLTSPPPPGLEVRDVHLDGRHVELLLAGVGGGRHQAEGVGHVQVLVCSRAEVSRVELSTKVKRRFVKISRSRRRVLLVESATLMQRS